MKKFIVTILLFCPALVPAEGSRVNVCEQQISEYVAQRFGQTVTRVQFRMNDKFNLMDLVSPNDALAYVAECPGYHYFEIRADDYTCTRLRHFGRVPNYIVYRSSDEGC